MELPLIPGKNHGYIKSEPLLSRKGEHSPNSNTNTMDDVDRLFECFKCGISPPQSAVKERKRSKGKLRQDSSRNEACTTSPGSASPVHKIATEAQLSTEKPGSAVVKADSLSYGKKISPVIFYGSPHGVPPKRPVSLLRLLREIRVDLAERNKSDLREEVWATFPRQDEAMKFLMGHRDVHIFSYQDHFKGQRRFLVSTYKGFWSRYRNMDSKIRHHYEVIQEGLPCHLYFDLEFSRKYNSGKNGDEMVDLLISVVQETLFEKYFLQGSEEWIIELDSSTEEKFSRHLIIRIPRTAFKDNLHAGAFVAEICSRITRARETDNKFEQLFIKKDSVSVESPMQLFVDTAVYSRNRCFRLALSSKAGKNSFLLPSGRFKCKDLREEEMFMASLICNIDLDCEKLLVCKMELDCIKTLHYDTEENHNFKKEYYGAPQVLSACSGDVSATYFLGKSLFPSLDNFIESVASIGNISGKIRSWYWFSEYGLMVYSMSRNRYCERIGRQHKSNHVMYIVDLRRAVYYQKCYDPDCRGYRSPLRPIPMDVSPSTLCISGSLYNDENTIDGCAKDSWWLEAVKVADNIESNQRSLGLGRREGIDEDDEDWWMAAESTASQVELMQCN
ncbi:DNA-directed primase/polymerase protein isoform X2 [Tripterygium wilfordii]|uniref:DNA-directed primase/polymerase protein isoform X2 n=1 Tax=Tripterygium wilfordii TaxID=458696 RepID=UPI0018F7F995|nr:DNA-directed primase/polymerase protein isoform X2 [Tripterygium wilfordii]